MSLEFCVYVGPYLKSGKFDAVALDIEDVFFCADTEDNDDIPANTIFSTPNQKRDNAPTRQMQWSRDRESPVLEGDDIAIGSEMRWFASAYKNEIDKIRESGCECVVGWGIVPYWL